MKRGFFFIERVIVVHTVTKTVEDLACSLVKSNYDATDYNLQTPSKFLFKPVSEMRSRIEHARAYIDIVTNVYVEEISKNCLSKWTNMIQSHIIKAVESSFENALQAGYCNWNNGLEHAISRISQ